MAFVPIPRLGPCPVGPETKVRVEFRKLDGPPVASRDIYSAKQLRWDRHKGQDKPCPYDIVGYEVVG